MPRKKKEQEAAQSQAPTQAQTQQSGDSSGLRLSLDQVAPKAPEAGAPSEAQACQYCGRSFKNVPKHEAKCKKNPATVEEAVPIAVPEEIMTAAIGSIFDTLAARFGPHWKLADLEAAALGAQWKKVLDVYAPDFADSKHLVLVLAGLNTALVLLPRVQQSKAIADAQARSTHAGREVGNGKDDTPPADVTGD